MEPKLHLNAASLSDHKTLLVLVNSDLVPGMFLSLVGLGSSDLFIDSVFASKNKLVYQGIKLCSLSLIDGMVNNCVNQIVTLLMTFPYGVVMLQVNFPWKITFDTCYTNGFSIRIHSRTLSISSECNTI